MSKAAELAALIGSGQAQGNKNLIINGAMTVSQRGDTTGQTGFAYSGPDRYQSAISSAGTWSISQSTTVPSGQGFANSLKLDCTTADGSLAAGDIFIFRQPVEAQNLQHLKYGTSSAEKLTISFWVRSNKTGTYWFELYHADAAYHIAKTYTISSANTWEHKTITFDGYTPTAINNDNGVGLYVNWWLAAGSTYAGGSATSGTWHNTAANRVVGQVNLADSTSNEWYITGVQLEIGDVATAFEHEDFGTTLEKCRRYCQVNPVHLGYNTGSQAVVSGSGTVQFTPIMRATPTVTGTFSPQSGNAGTFALATTTSNNVHIYNSANNWSASQGIFVNDFKADAEL